MFTLVWAVLLTSFSVQFQFSPGWIINSSGLVGEVQCSWRSFPGHPCVVGVSYHHQHSELALKVEQPRLCLPPSIVWFMVMGFRYI